MKSSTDGAFQNLLGVLSAFGKTEGVDYEAATLLQMRDIGEYDIQADYNDATTSCAGDPQCLCGHSRYWPASCSTADIMYWYHPGYLGNTEFITDTDGNPYQFFWYSPWGESLKDQHKYDGQGTNAFNTAFRFNGKDWDEETGNYYYGARYYDPRISHWLSVDPLSSERPNLTPYNFMSNNPVMRIDPTGMLDGWVEDECGNTTYDPDVHSQQDLVDQGKSGTYKGEEGVGYNPETGKQVNYFSDGSSFETPQMLAEAEIDGGKMSDHARALKAGRELGIYKGQEKFIKGTIQLTGHIAGQFGNGISYAGYGAAFIPGAQPIAGGLIVVGNTLSTVSSLSSAAIDFSEGNNVGATLNFVNALVPGAANKFVDRNVTRGLISTQGGNILKAGSNVKSSAADYLINR